MAGSRIKGITIEIDGNTTKLTDSLKKVDSSLRDTQNQLKDVNKLLKYDPSNVELLRQKHDLLGKAVKDTKTRQEELRKALEESKKAGDTEENRKQQDALQRELVEKRIPDPAVPHLIDILLALAGVSRVEVVGDVGYVEYGYVVGQVAVHGEHEVVVGDGVLDLHRHTVHISMDSAVGA